MYKAWLIILLSNCLLFSACESSVVKPSPNDVNTPSLSATHTPQASQVQSPEPKSIQNEDGIRKIDFANFTYNWFPQYLREKPDTQTTLEKGKTFIPKADDAIFLSAKIELHNIIYSDLDKDGVEEAVVVLWVFPERSASLTTFVFKHDKGKAKQIWVHESGSRAHYGMRNLYLLGDQLVIEEYMRAKGEGLNVSLTFSRSFYKLKGNQMLLIQNEKVPNDQPDDEPKNFLQRNVELPKDN
jgi:hypothetical protein